MGEPPEYAEFDDLDTELNEVLIRTFCSILEIKRNVILLDEDQWVDLIEEPETKTEEKEIRLELKHLLGRANIDGHRAIYINPDCKRQYQVLIPTVVHELLHIKYPKKDEDAIYKMERKMTGRYDYTPHWLAKEKCGNCKRKGWRFAK